MAEFLYRLRLVRPDMLDDGGTREEQAAVADHFAYLQKLHGEGVVRFAGRTTTDHERTFGIVVLDADGDAAAQRVMNEDPAVLRGLMRATLYPFRTALS